MLSHGKIEKAIRCKVKARHSDGKGLLLNVTASGSASWILRLQSAGRRRDYGLGGYPAVSLSHARYLAEQTRQAVAEGRDVLGEKRRPAATPTLGEALAAVIAAKSSRWRSAKVAQDWRGSLERHAGRLLAAPVDSLTRADVLGVVVPLAQKRGATGQMVRWRLRSCFAWAQAYGHRDDNPAGESIAAALPARPPRVHRRALPHHAEVGAALRAVDVSTAGPAVTLAVRLVALTATRSAEAVGATWSEIDHESATWTIPAERMKAGRAHRIPLSRAAMDVLETARGLGDGLGYVFPSPYGRGRSVDGASLRFALARAGVDSSVHGLRASFRTWAQETAVPWDVAELSLAHAVGNSTIAAYARSDELERRRPVMESWGRHITG